VLLVCKENKAYKVYRVTLDLQDQQDLKEILEIQEIQVELQEPQDLKEILEIQVELQVLLVLRGMQALAANKAALEPQGQQDLKEILEIQVEPQALPARLGLPVHPDQLALREILAEPQGLLEFSQVICLTQSKKKLRRMQVHRNFKECILAEQ
jgi:hypothetical protein